MLRLYTVYVCNIQLAASYFMTFLFVNHFPGIYAIITALVIYHILAKSLNQIQSP